MYCGRARTPHTLTHTHSKSMTSTTSITYRLANYSVPFDANEVVHLLNSHAKETSSSSSTSLPPPKSKLQKQLQLHAANDSMFSILAIQNQSNTVVGIQHCFVSFSCAECRPVLEVLNTYVLPSCREGMDVEERLHEKSEEEAKRRRCTAARMYAVFLTLLRMCTN
jgi:hypothetical protein